MNPTTALAILRELGVPALDTADAAAALGLTTAAASQTLTRLARAGLLCNVRHGTWWLEDALDPLRLPEHLTAPFPAYVSLQTALYRHGLIEQLPEVVYAVSLGKTKRLNTQAGGCHSPPLRAPPRRTVAPPRARLTECSLPATVVLCWRSASQPSSPRGSTTCETCEGALASRLASSGLPPVTPEM